MLNLTINHELKKWYIHILMSNLSKQEPLNMIRKGVGMVIDSILGYIQRVLAKYLITESLDDIYRHCISINTSDNDKKWGEDLLHFVKCRGYENVDIVRGTCINHHIDEIFKKVASVSESYKATEIFIHFAGNMVDDTGVNLDSSEKLKLWLSGFNSNTTVFCLLEEKVDLKCILHGKIGEYSIDETNTDNIDADVIVVHEGTSSTLMNAFIEVMDHVKKAGYEMSVVTALALMRYYGKNESITLTSNKRNLLRAFVTCRADYFGICEDLYYEQIDPSDDSDSSESESEVSSDKEE